MIKNQQNAKPASETASQTWTPDKRFVDYRYPQITPASPLVQQQDKPKVEQAAPKKV